MAWKILTDRHGRAHPFVWGVFLALSCLLLASCYGWLGWLVVRYILALMK